LTPLDDVSGLVVWLNADDVQGSQFDPVTVWEDKSGNNNDATNGLSYRWPALFVNQINGHNAVRFDGSDESLLSINVSQPDTIIFVAHYISGERLMDNGGESNRQPLQYLSSDGMGVYLLPAAQYFSGTGSSPSTYNILEYAIGGAASALYHNGEQVATASLVSGNLVNPYIGGAGDNATFVAADIAEVLIYNKILSTEERVGVEDYLSAKYGIPVTN
jgi:hypothetical protein